MKARRYVLAIDQGTTGTTVLVLDAKLAVKARVNREIRQFFPRPGWVEHDLNDIWRSVELAIATALRRARVSGSEIAAIGITNQRETTAVWNRSTGKPVHRAIVWQDRRTAAACASMRERGLEPLFQTRTGLLLDPYFSGTKLSWLLREIPGLRAQAERGDLCFGTIDSFLLHRLSDGAVHASDVSNCSRTILFDIHALQWDPELCRLLEIPAALLPRPCSSSEHIASTGGLRSLPDGIPIAGIAGDQQAALFGQACFAPGESKCTYGTGAFLLMNVGAKAPISGRRLLSTVAWRIGDEVAYALEGSAFVAGAAVQWLRDGLGLIKRSSEIERLARQVPDSGGVVFVPALTGLGAPHWRPEARGVITGLHRGTTRAHLARATLEGMALQILDLSDAMAADSGRPLTALRVDGGASQNGLLMQLQSDLLGVPVERPRLVESTALGAAFLAGLAVGFWKDREQVRAVHRVQKRFLPRADPKRRAELVELRERWNRAVGKA
jgi:glycerol kinase